MKKSLAAALLTLTATAALAGTVSNEPVVVWTDAQGKRSARGGVRWVRGSMSSVEFIGCTLRAFDNGLSGADCSARTAGNVYLGCYTTKPSLIQAVTSINSSTFLVFSVNADGTCSTITVNNNSSNL